jgi:hypothetical protein
VQEGAVDLQALELQAHLGVLVAQPGLILLLSYPSQSLILHLELFDLFSKLFMFARSPLHLQYAPQIVNLFLHLL